MSDPKKGQIETEMAYMIAIPRNTADIEDFDKLFSKLKGVKDFQLMNIQHDDEFNCPVLYITYKEEVYLIQVEQVEYDYSDGIIKHQMAQENIDELEGASAGLQVSMLFSEHAQESYHLLLKVLYCLVPDMVGVYNCNSFMLLSPVWVKTAAEALTPPAPSYLYTIHAVNDDDGTVWLHTHGLNCCGIIDLEIMGTNTERYNDLANVLTTLADNAISKGDIEDEKVPIFTATLSSGDYMVATWVDWEEALGAFKKDILGGKSDRDEVHGCNTGIIFTYLSEKDYKKGKYTSLMKIKESEFENPIFFVSNEETLRMSELARERISYLREALEQADAKAIVKIGLSVDEDKKEEAGCDHEHIWFEVKEITDTSITGTLIQDPYFVESMHEGSEGTYGYDQLTDWILYVNEERITPDSVYLLSLLK